MVRHTCPRKAAEDRRPAPLLPDAAAIDAALTRAQEQAAAADAALAEAAAALGAWLAAARAIR